MDADDVRRTTRDGLEQAQEAGRADPNVRDAQRFFIEWMLKSLAVVAVLGVIFGGLSAGAMGAVAGFGAALFLMIPVGFVIGVVTVVRTSNKAKAGEKDRW